MYQLNNRNWRKKEPVNVMVEKPRFVGQIVEMLYGTPIDYKQIATHTNLPIQLIKNTIEAHIIKPDASNNKGPDCKPNDNVISFAKKKT